MVGHLFQNYDTIYVRFFPTYTCNHYCYTIYVRFFPTYTCNHYCYTIYVRFFVTYTCLLSCFVGFLFPSIWPFSYKRAYTAISRKAVGKSARGNPERYCGWFLIHCFSKKFQTMAREAMDVCLRVLKESNKSRFDSYSVRKSVLIISHITFRDCRVHSFSDNLSRNSCICAPKRPYICVTNKHAVYAVTKSRRIRGTELYRQ